MNTEDLKSSKGNPVSDFDEIFEDVIAELRENVGAEQVSAWGYINIKSWVNDYTEQGEESPYQIAKGIIEDWQNELL